MQRAVSRAERTVTAAGLGLAAAALLALGILWHLDRTRRWETPRWPAPDFVALGAPAAPAGADRSAADADSAGGAAGTWVVAVNLECPHCRAGMKRTLESRAARRSAVRVLALLVDTPEPPPEAEWSALGADQVWWDRAQRWRRRWGHRVYGEVLCFAPDGALLRTLPPFAGRDAEAAAGPARAESETSPGTDGGHERR